MIGEITRFGDAYASAYGLPTVDPDDDVGTGDVGEHNVILPRGGVFDPIGSGPAFVGARVITVGGVLDATTGAALRTKANHLYSMLGRRSKLWLEDPHSTDIFWRWARLINIDAGTNVHDIPRRQQPMALDFEVSSPTWKDQSETVLTGTLSTATYTYVTMENVGTGYVRDMTISITGSGANITWLGLFQDLTPKSYVYWEGVLAAGAILTIDTGRMIVTLGGANAYDGFHFHSAHRTNDWLRLSPASSNALRIERMGGDASTSYEIRYYEAYN